MDEKLLREIDVITLAELDEDIPWASVMTHPDEAGQEKVLAVGLVRELIKPFKEKLEGETDRRYMKRALESAKWCATQLVMGGELQTLIERTTVFILDDARKTGWYQNMEYDTLQELLASIYDETKHESSTFYDFRFITEKLLPAAKELKIPVGTLIGASQQMRKLRKSVPACRIILEKLEDGSYNPQEAAHELNHFLSQVASRTVTTKEFSNEVDKWQGKQINTPDPFEGYFYIVPGKRTWMMVEVLTDVEQRAVEMATKGLINWKLGDVGDLARDLMKVPGGDE